MSVKPESQGSKADTFKLLVAVALLVAGIVGFYYFSDQLMVFRFLGILIAVVLAALVAYQTQLGKNAWIFVLGSRNELRKMVWPTRQETVQTTVAVIGMVVVLGIFMWLLDMFLFWAFSGITGQGG